MRIGVKAVALDDFALNTMNGQVHFCQSHVVRFQFRTIHPDGFIDGFIGMIADKMAGLHKHAARTTSRVVNNTMVGLNKVYNKLHQRWRCKKLASLLSSGTTHGEFHEEKFINPSKNIPADIFHRVFVEYPNNERSKSASKSW